MKRVRFLALASVLWLLPSMPECSQTSFGAFLENNFRLVPGFHVDGAITRAHNQKNQYFVEHYSVNSLILLDIEFLAIRDLTILMEFTVEGGMGHTKDNVVFDPMDAQYGTDPVLEYRFPLLCAQAGMEHHCFHGIDVQQFRTIYYNKPFVGVSTTNYRAGDFWTSQADSAGQTWLKRVSGQLRWGFFMRDSTSSLVGGQTNAVHEFTAEARYAAWKWRCVALGVHAQGKIGYWDNYDKSLYHAMVYWMYSLSPEVAIVRKEWAGMLFATFTMDHLPRQKRIHDAYGADEPYPDQWYPRLSKDRLIEIGIRYVR